MAFLEIGSYVVTVSFGGFLLIRIFNATRKNLCSIILNILLGGSLFLILNIMGASLPFNLVTGCMIAFLGVPGVVAIILLRILFGIF